MVASFPLRAAVGKINVRVSDTSSGAELSKQLNDAFRTLSQDFGWYIDQLEGYLPEDLYNALEPTFIKSQGLVPVDKGDLKASGYLEMEPFRGGARAEIGYGRNNTPEYAIFVHEVPAEHKSPTRDKFLQVPLEEDYHDILQRVTDSVKMRMNNK